MAVGIVKWFNNAKGYGFIVPEGGGEDLFAHYSSICMDGYKTLKTGQRVQYELVQGQKGLHATNISPVASAEGGTITSLGSLQDDVGHAAQTGSPE